MHVKIVKHSRLYRSSSLWIARLFLVLGMVCALLLMVPGNGKTTYAASLSTGYDTDPVKTAVDIARPAVVRIFTFVKGHLTVRISNSNVTFPQGNGAYSVTLSGSGTFITAHGDILTADHVVSPPGDVFFNAAAPDVANYLNQHGTPTTADQVVQMLLSGQLSSNASYDQKTSEVFLSTDYTGPLNANTLRDVPSALHATATIEKESSLDQKDVAIIHVPLNDMPSVQLGDSSNVQVQDELTIIGFPGNGDVSSTPTNLLTSSVNKITVSSIKTTNTGAPVIQVGGNVEHGDSGGPALDSHGTVVGIVSFGLASSSPGATSFLQASSSAQGLVQQLNLDTAPGTFQKRWSQALIDYSATTAGHWHTAAQELSQLAAAYPDFKAVTPYLNTAQTQAKNEQVSPSQATPVPTPTSNNGSSSSSASPLTSWLLTAGGVAVLLLLVFFTFMVGLGRFGKKKKGASTQPQVKAAPGAQKPLPPVSNMGAGPPQSRPSATPQDYSTGMGAFGAPVSGPTQSPSPMSTVTSGVLRPWPCGHMNRSNARFCSICGEPAPRRVEQ
jgi:S1-C subfamily serine protease